VLKRGQKMAKDNLSVRALRKMKKDVDNEMSDLHSKNIELQARIDENRREITKKDVDAKELDKDIKKLRG